MANSNIVSVPVPLRGLGRPDREGTGKGWVWDGYGTGMGRDGELDNNMLLICKLIIILVSLL